MVCHKIRVEVKKLSQFLLSIYVYELYNVKPYFSGALLIDEMKISPRSTFDRYKMEVTGFTDLGKYTPELQKNKLGDHALVLLFQPFQGKWVQAVGTFLSRGCATGIV